MERGHSINNFVYLILLNPGHNRIYFEASRDISVNELRALLGERVKPPAVKPLSVAGVEYLSFETDLPLDSEAVKVVSRMSSFYALFRTDLREEGLVLFPVDCGEWRSFPDSLNTILKYSGKTNEQFTRLMVNMAEAYCKSITTGRQIQLLDPLAGKGTTLFEGVIRGFDVTGIELTSKLSDECEGFFIKYLENGRYKHKASKEARSVDGKKISSLRQVEFANSKEAFSSGNTQCFRLFCGDASQINRYVKKQSIDIAVMDLPYGVQHASVSGKEKSRSAEGLLEWMLPCLSVVMRGGGSVVIAFNAFTTKKERIADMLVCNSFMVVDETMTGSFLHRVDQAIKRDIVIAVKN